MSERITECEPGGARTVIVENRQEAIFVPDELLGKLEVAGLAALKLIEQRDLALAVIPSDVSVSLLDDVMIGEVHGQYMDDPSPTDVITFPYGESGEVLISLETAEVQAKEYAVGWEREVTLYLVHGILHLCGYDDIDEEGRKRMSELQEALLEEVLGGGGMAI